MNMPSTLRPKQKIIPEDISEQKKIPLTLKPKQKPKEEIISPTEENDIERDIERSQAQLTSRGIEAVAGLPGDLINFVGGLFGVEPNVPGSQELRKFSEDITKGYTKPKNEFEEAIGEVFQDVALMALPGAKKYNVMRNLGIPIVGNLLKQGLKYNNAEEKTQAYTKIGTMVALDLISQNRGALKKHLTSLFQQADNAIPKGIRIDASNLEKSLNVLEKELSRGGEKGTTTKSLKKITEIKKDIQNGKIEAKDLAAYRPSINEAIDELGGFSSEVSAKYKPAAVRNLNLVKNEVINVLDEYGRKFNPEFLKYHQSANEAYAAYANSNKIVKFLQNKVPYVPINKATQLLFGYGPLTASTAMAALSPTTAAAGFIGAGGYQAFKVLNRVTNSPTLAKYYGNVLKSAIAGNIPQTAKNLKVLDKALEEEENNL